jgi:hypothetical protein
MGPSDGTGFGIDRGHIAESQAEQACAEARRLGILNEPDLDWENLWDALTNEAHAGTEHLVELDENQGAVIKFTIPPNFGLIPYIASRPIVTAEDGPSKCAVGHALEFRPATPLEYLERWLDANEVFGDNVRLIRVIRWKDGLISFVIGQPQYHGEPASELQITNYFKEAGWTQLPFESGHILFYNHAYQVLAIDALPRNCRIHDGGLMPFDVILCRPDDALSDFLRLYPQ